MRRAVLGVALLVSGSAFASDTELDAVRAAVAVLVGQEPAQATVAVTRWERVLGEKTPREGSAGAMFFVSASKSGVSVSCDESLLRVRGAGKKKDGPDVLANIVGGVDLRQAARWMNYGAPFLLQLESAELISDTETTLEEQPAHLLKLKLKTEHESEGGAEATTVRTLSLWVDAQHLPLASQSVDSTTGGFLVVKFENSQKAERRYARVADRLVLLEETEEASTQSMGHTFQNKQTAKLTLKP